MKLREYAIALLFLFLYINPVWAQEFNSNTVMNETITYLDSLEWDQDFLDKLDNYARYQDIYLNKLISKDSEEIYTASVMLGLLNVKSATSKIEQLRTESPKARVGLLFALCKLKTECTSQKAELAKLGEVTELAGRATTLANIRIVELLSLMTSNDFIDYALKLRRKTNEVWQHEAIDVAIVRHKKLKNTK